MTSPTPSLTPSPTPDPSLVKDLAAYDPKLRLRWARHSDRWFIERRLEQRHPQFVLEQPLPESTKPVQRDLWEGWESGYVHVLTVAKELCHWNLIAPALTSADSWRQGGMKEINRQLDDLVDSWETKTDRNIDNWAEAASDDAYEHLAWLSGRRVALYDPEPKYTDSGHGYLVRDKRHSLSRAE